MADRETSSYEYYRQLRTAYGYGRLASLLCAYKRYRALRRY